MKKEMLATVKNRATSEAPHPAPKPGLATICLGPSADKGTSRPAPLCYTRVEFAAALRVSVATVDRMIAAGEIRVRRVRGKAVRILRAEAERYLNGENLKAEIGKAEMTLPLPGPLTPAIAGRRGSQIGKGGKA